MKTVPAPAANYVRLKTAPSNGAVAARQITVDGVPLTLAPSLDIKADWIGDPFVVKQLEAAWLTADADEHPMNPRLVGPPGLGKTSLAYAVGRSFGHPVFVFQCTMDTRPEDLIVTPVLSGRGKVEYRASSLVTAVICGGVAVLDEGNRMNERAWASLVPLLDHRRYVESIVAGIKIPAHPEFRFVTTMNDDASTYELPEYIRSRLRPKIEITWPERGVEEAILQATLPGLPAELITRTIEMLQKAHAAKSPLSTRDGISIAQFASRLMRKGETLSRSFTTAVQAISDEKARTKRSSAD